MGSKVYIELFDRLTQTKTVHAVTLPVQIGKEPSAGSHILLDGKYETISRLHGRIELDGEHLLYVDDSTNGSLVNGVALTKAACRISKKDVIRIQNYNLRFVDADPLVIKHTRGDLSEVADVDLLPSMSLSVKLQNDALVIADSQDEDDSADHIVRLTYAGGEDVVTCVVSPAGEQLGVKVNQVVRRENAFDIKAFDVLGVGDDRFEILKPGVEKIVCGNDACHLLNDLKFEEGCQWCGFHLTAAGGRTRVVHIHSTD